MALSKKMSFKKLIYFRLSILFVEFAIVVGLMKIYQIGLITVVIYNENYEVSSPHNKDGCSLNHLKKIFSEIIPRISFIFLTF